MTEPRAIATPVGFLFTDIEGSTRLWEAYPAAMAAAQTQHDALLRHCIERNGGELYRSAGDSVQAAYPDGAGAVRAAIEAQTALSAADWGTPNKLRVRMAIHVTRVERTPGGDYRSPQLDLLGALLSLAHGGQILLTSAAAKALHGGFPDGSTLTDLGVGGCRQSTARSTPSRSGTRRSSPNFRPSLLLGSKTPPTERGRTGSSGAAAS